MQRPPRQTLGPACSTVQSPSSLVPAQSLSPSTSLIHIQPPSLSWFCQGVTLARSFSVSRLHFPICAEKGLSWGCPSSPCSSNILDVHYGKQEGLAGSSGTGANLGARVPFGVMEENPADGPQNPQSSSPAQIWLPPPSLCYAEPCWTRLGSPHPPESRILLPLAGAAPAPVSAQSALKNLSGIPSPTPSPNSLRGEQSEGETGREQREPAGARGREMQMVFILLSFKC